MQVPGHRGADGFGERQAGRRQRERPDTDVGGRNGVADPHQVAEVPERPPDHEGNAPRRQPPPEAESHRRHEHDGDEGDHGDDGGELGAQGQPGRQSAEHERAGAVLVGDEKGNRGQEETHGDDVVDVGTALADGDEPPRHR